MDFLGYFGYFVSVFWQAILLSYTQVTFVVGVILVAAPHFAKRLPRWRTATGWLEKRERLVVGIWVFVILIPALVFVAFQKEKQTKSEIALLTNQLASAKSEVQYALAFSGM